MTIMHLAMGQAPVVLGDIEKNQRSVLFKHDFEFSEIISNGLVHQTNFGFE